MTQTDHKLRSKRRKDFFDHFEKLAPTLGKYRKRYAYFWNDIVRYCNYFIHEDDSVLEIGCATGEMLTKMKGKKKTGIDFSPHMIQIAKTNFPELNFYIQDAEDLNLEEKFGTIVIYN